MEPIANADDPKRRRAEVAIYASEARKAELKLAELSMATATAGTRITPIDGNDTG